MQDAKEEVRSRLNIEDVIGEYVQLKRAGRNFKGLSPFSGEKTPSFYVSPDKNIWHDFSSNKGGDVFSFVMEVEGIDFRQALELLARKAGVDLSVYDTAGSQRVAQLKKRLHEAHRLAAQYYQQSLVQNQRALEYVFKKRALSKEIVQTFGIGYAPDRGDALVQFLTKKGFNKQELRQAGLVNRYDSDLFRGRMMIPLSDPTGQVIGFTGRIVSDDPNAPKYLNTPQTLLYDKGRHVFGLAQAKEAIRQQDYSVVVEGNLDVVSSHQAGITGVVATAGTALTEHHLKALGRLSNNIRFAFDGDRAGIAATERAIPMAQEVGVDVMVISLPEGSKDPDELIKKDPGLWQKAIDDAEPVVDWILRQYSKREDLSTATGKRRYSTAAMNVIRSLKDPVEQDHYLQLIGSQTGSSQGALKDKLAGTAVSEAPKLKPIVAPTDTELVIDNYIYQDNLLAALLVDPATHDLLAGINAEMFSNEARRAVVDYVLANQGSPVLDTPADLQKFDTYVKILLLKADTRFADWSDQDRYLETARLVRQVITEHRQKQKNELNRDLRAAEEIGDEAKASEIRAKLNKLIKET